MTRMYVNGQQVASGNQTSSAPRINSDGAFYIGRSNWADQYPNMEIKDFRIYNIALSADTIGEMYSAQAALYALIIPASLEDGDMLPETSQNFAVSWSCSDLSALNGFTVVGKETDNSVVLTADIGGLTKRFNVTVLKKDHKVTLEPDGKTVKANLYNNRESAVTFKLIVASYDSQGALFEIVVKDVLVGAKTLLKGVTSSLVNDTTDKTVTAFIWDEQYMPQSNPWLLK